MTEQQQAAMRQAIDALLTMIVMAHDWLPENLEKPTKAITALRQALEQQPAAQWVGLTLEDKQEYMAQDYGASRLDAMDWADKRLREKNGGKA